MQTTATTQRPTMTLAAAKDEIGANIILARRARYLYARGRMTRADHDDAQALPRAAAQRYDVLVLQWWDYWRYSEWHPAPYPSAPVPGTLASHPAYGHGEETSRV